MILFSSPAVSKHEPLAGNSLALLFPIRRSRFQLWLHTSSPSFPSLKETPHESAALTSVRSPASPFCAPTGASMPPKQEKKSCRCRLPAEWVFAGGPPSPSPILSTPGAQETSYSLACDSLSLKCAHINPGTLLCLSRSITSDRPRSNTVYTLFNGTATRQARDGISSQFRRSGESLRATSVFADGRRACFCAPVAVCLFIYLFLFFFCLSIESLAFN